MRKFFEKLFYSFGFSCVNTNSPHLDFLEENILPSFKKRKLVDVGCGDGRMTKILAKIFEATDVLAVDYIPSLVKSAQKRGLKTKILNVEEEEIDGELAVMWGVLHHLVKREKALQNLAKNFKYVFIREEIKHPKIFEIGDLMTEAELVALYEGAFGKKNITFIKDKNSKATLLFYTNPEK